MKLSSVTKVMAFIVTVGLVTRQKPLYWGPGIVLAFSLAIDVRDASRAAKKTQG